jgi:XTP/dITP diphosphohydrolase
MDICVATNNRHKVHELKAIFLGDRLITPDELGIEFSFEENGDSFFANSMGKAQALLSLTKGGFPVLADDSGLCVDALGGAPGIHSARFGDIDGRSLDAHGKNELLLSRLLPGMSRKCRFVCCMVLLFESDRFLVAQETLHGSIVDRPRGNAGFGYDPIVFLSEKACTVAELGDVEKNRISHRAKAARRIMASLGN